MAKIVGMGSEVEHEPLDPSEGKAYVLLEMKVEDARELAPCLADPVALEVVLRKAEER